MVKTISSAQKPSICAGCPLIEAPYVPPSCTCEEEPCQADMLLVGIAPSYQEVASGTPLCGPAGRKVDAAIQWALTLLPKVHKILRVRKTNIVRCRTTSQGKKGLVNRDPTKEEIAHCTSRHLVGELGIPGLKVIVPMGDLVHRTLCSAKFKECVGSRIKYGTARITAHLKETLWTKVKTIGTPS